MLPENEALPENKDFRGDIKDKYEIPNEVSHPITLTPSTQVVYGMDHMKKLEAGIHLPIHLSDALCNDTGVPKKKHKAIQGKGRKVCVEVITTAPHEDHLQTPQVRRSH